MTDAADRPDLRLPALAAGAWLAGVLAGTVPTPLWLGAGVLVGVWALRRSRRIPGSWPTVAAWLVAAAAAAVVVTVRADAVTESPVADLARERATVRVLAAPTSDVRVSHGRFGRSLWVRATVLELVGRGRLYRLRAPVLLLGQPPWTGVRLGSRVLIDGRLAPSDGGDLAAVVSVRGPPRVVAPPDRWHRAADRVRAGIRAAVSGAGPGPAALVPSLVDGDDAALPARIVEDFRTCGLTHLLAVSGTNLTLVVGALLVLARGIGVRARGLAVVGLLGVAAFVLLARAEPSVVRAAAMGSVALVGMGQGGRARGTRAWGVAVLVVVLMDPWLVVSPGFALSAGATAGILFLAPGWRDAMARWLPRWVAEALAVPLAAQVVCTPLVAVLSGQVSLVAVLANMLAAPVVAPATVLGLLGGVVDLISSPVARLVAAPAGWCAAWIIATARHCSGVELPAADISTGAVSIGLLSLGCAAVSLLLHRVLVRPVMTGALGCLLIVVMLVPLPTPGWPPPGWLMVACDVGQGDGLVLRAGEGQAVVVDTGPEPRDIDRCLRRLHVRRVPVVVLTHFHADHVGGLSGVLHGRSVGQLETSPYADPAYGARQVLAQSRRAGVPETAAPVGSVQRVGALTWQVLAPLGPASPASDSPPNDDSLVLYVRTAGLTILLMGDEEVPSQTALHAAYPGLRADVLKVSHHGSAKQDPELVGSVGAQVGLISCGLNNDYGHPTPSTLRLLQRSRIRAWRTDLDGDLAVVRRGGRVTVLHR